MKKFVCILLSVLFLAMGIGSVSAATRQDVIDYAYDTIPAKYPTYHIWAENILGQYDLSEGEWDEVLAIVKELASAIPEDKGASLHTYSSSQHLAALNALNAFCDLTGSTYLIRDVAAPKHKGDQEVLLYKEDGSLVAVVDGDLYPDVTGLAETTNNGTLWLVLSGVLALGAVAVVVLRRKAFCA